MAEEGGVFACHTVEEWTRQLEQANDSKKLLVNSFVRELVVVIDFTASWCGPCRMIAPIFADLAKKLPNVIFLEVDIDELKAVAQDWAIDAMPTFVFLKEGTIVDKIVGAQKEELPRRIELHLPS